MLPDGLAEEVAMGPERHPHTVKAFDEDLDRIRTLVIECGTLASRQVRNAVAAMVQRDVAQAGVVEMQDGMIDALQADAERDVISTIGRRAPLAEDLRELISAIKIVGDLERVGDLAKNIAKRTPEIVESASIEPVIMVPAIAELVAGMIDDVLKAYINRDVDLALEIIQRDRGVDEYYNSLFRSLLVHMIEDPHNTTPSANLLFVAKNLERVGDHATNIAELVYFTATGETLMSRHAIQDM
jgi:phosphate transport system protein